MVKQHSRGTAEDSVYQLLIMLCDDHGCPKEGLIHANHGSKVVDYLKTQLETATAENVRHGAAMGLGLSSMATHRQGEACGIAMGLVMLGSANPTAIQDMVGYAQLTQHEKIIRGLSVGIALIMYGRREEAEPLIDNLVRDKDPILRRSAVYCIALSHCGTGNNASIRRLLHIAVSDVNDDVKRAAVMCLGFLLFRTPEQCPTMVSLLSESYNPHVRYGAALALGIACAGTGLREAIELLEPMLTDSVSYVRQGCMMAMAMILIQQNEYTSPKVKEFRDHLTKIIQDKVEDTMTKFGAIVAQGILDAGGRNMSLSLMSRNGQTDMEAVVGLLLFLQYWYWFSLSLCLSMAFKPTALIGLNDELKMPKMQFHCAAKPSCYAYPTPLEEKKEEKVEKVETAVLSITAKAKLREQQKTGAKMDTSEAPADAGETSGSEPKVAKMDTDESAATDAAKKDAKTDEKAKTEEKTKDGAAAKDKDAEAADKDKDAKGKEKEKDGKAKDETKEKEKTKVPEPNFHLLDNPARVMRAQLKTMSIPKDSRFESLKKLSIGGIMILRDKNDGEPTEFVEPVRAGGTRPEEEPEVDPPEPFVFLDQD